MLTCAALDSTALWAINIAVTTALGVMIGLVGYLGKRAISGLDATMARLAGMVEDERKARLDDVRQLTDRQWSLNGDLKGNYVERTESMRQFGTLMQRLDQVASAIDAKLDNLPCRQGGVTIRPTCPGEGGE